MSPTKFSTDSDLPRDYVALLPVDAPARRPLVLIVEDHDDTRFMLRTLLSINGFEVAESADGESAVADALRLEPDVILLDGTLPRLDGVGAARRIHAAREHQHIVFLSGLGGNEVVRAALGAGCDIFLLKPVNIDELLLIVQRLAAQPRKLGRTS